MQDAQALKLQVIQSIDRIPFDSLRLLAEFAAFLEAKSASLFSWRGTSDTNVASDAQTIQMDAHIPASPMRIASPRLVNPSQAADFELEVIMDDEDDTI